MNQSGTKIMNMYILVLKIILYISLYIVLYYHWEGLYSRCKNPFCELLIDIFYEAKMHFVHGTLLHLIYIFYIIQSWCLFVNFVAHSHVVMFCMESDCGFSMLFSSKSVNFSTLVWWDSWLVEEQGNVWALVWSRMVFCTFHCVDQLKETVLGLVRM